MENFAKMLLLIIWLRIFLLSWPIVWHWYKVLIDIQLPLHGFCLISLKSIMWCIFWGIILALGVVIIAMKLWMLAGGSKNFSDLILSGLLPAFPCKKERWKLPLTINLYWLFFPPVAANLWLFKFRLLWQEGIPKAWLLSFRLFNR